MKQSKATTFILIILILTYMIINVNAKEENTDKNSITLGVYSSSQAYAPGDSVNLKYTLMSEEDKKIDLFRIQIDYDPIALTFDRVNTTDNISASIFKTVEQDGKVTFLYLKKDKELLLESGKESEIFDVVFKSNKDVTTPYEVSINSGIVSIIDDKIKVLKHSNPDATALKFDYPEPEVTSLEKLVPSVGELIPSFSPENLNYSMQVSNKVSDLTFEAVPQNEDGIVKVNRKTMKTAGFTTDFKITSYAQDGTKSIYTVSVYRQTKEESEESSQIEESSESDSSSSKSESKASSSKQSTSQKATTSSKKSTSSKSTASSKSTTSKSTSSKSTTSSKSATSKSTFKFNNDEEEAADEANIVREATEQSLIVSNNSVAMPVVIGIILLILLALLVMFGKNTKLANKENPDKADDDSQKEDD